MLRDMAAQWNVQRHYNADTTHDKERRNLGKRDVQGLAVFREISQVTLFARLG